MEISLILDENDYLTYQLYRSSKNKNIKSSQRKSWLILSGSFLILGYSLLESNRFLSYYFLIAGVVFLCFYPFYQKYRYKKYFIKYISDNFQYKVGKECRVNFTGDFIETKDVTGECKFFTKEITQIDEIISHYFIRMKSGESLIIPKLQINNQSFVTELLTIFKNPEILMNKELDWK